MSDIDVEQLGRDLDGEEGFKLTPYLDTNGHWTVGRGRNLDAHGQRHDREYTREECEAFFAEDVKAAIADLDRHTPWWRTMTEPRQRALCNLCFNMGWGDGTHGLSSFAHTLALLKEGDYEVAADRFLLSKWAKDVKATRAKAVTDLIRHG